MTQHQAPEVTSELLPCPFCGGPATVIVTDCRPCKVDGWTDAYSVWCNASVLCGGRKSKLYNDRSNAITAWNTRATQPLSLTVDWPADAEFQLGDLVQKKGRASWRGHVRGWYRTELTALGYAVESMYEPGSVQIYPASALDRLQSLSLPVDIDRSGLAQEVE